ncbi:discoidin domain-containing protein [Dactylosporangium sucinum]|uniref:F5/8 type C domain-containing protein n=1 Tax=Dactylosporangium sucinum TaxID=1424081 RepID=A0A917SXW8_9ACTN|nr:discoidin domain-containing protein [Dactylosporangium sucinum]GGM03957.1 hypothetical protein GCM10007977_001630 [Dactylosporangium sucinum]
MSHHRAELLRRSKAAILMLVIGVALMISAGYVRTGTGAPADRAAAAERSGDTDDVWSDPTDVPTPQTSSSPPASPSPSPSMTSPSPSPAPTSPSASPTAPAPSVNLALHRPATATSEVRTANGASYATDGNASTFWEGANHGLPQNLTIDLQGSYPVTRVVIKLPPLANWPARTQTLSVLGSTNGTTFTTVKGSAAYAFGFTGGKHEVTITVPRSTVRYLRLAFTGNSTWDAGQASEVEIYS